MYPNLAEILSSASIVELDGVVIHPKEGLTLKPLRSKLAITAAAYGKVKDLIEDIGFEISFTPDGQFTQAIADVLHPYKTKNIGDACAAVRNVAQATINTTTDVLTDAAHGYLTGQAVKISYTLTRPGTSAAFPHNAALYVRRIDADTYTLHTSSSGATNNTDKLNFTSNGVGHLRVARNTTMRVYAQSLGFYVDFKNVQISQLAGLMLSAGATAWKQTTVRAFHASGELSSTSLYEIGVGTFGTALDEANYIVATPTVRFGDSATPWSDLPVGSAVEIDFALATSEIGSDAVKASGLRFDGVVPTVKLAVPGLTLGDYLTELGMTGSRGDAITEQSLYITAGAIEFITRASLDAADIQMQAGTHIIPQLSFTGVRGHTDGAPDAWYQLGLD